MSTCAPWPCTPRCTTSLTDRDHQPLAVDGKDRDVSTASVRSRSVRGWRGAVFGTLSALRLADRLGFARAFAASLLLSCFAPLLIAAVPLTGIGLAVAVVGILLVSGVGLGSANIYSVTLRQIMIPADQLARSVGAYRQIMCGSIPIGVALAGVLGEAVGTRGAVAFGTLGLALSALPMLTRRIRALATPQAAASSACGTSLHRRSRRPWGEEAGVRQGRRCARAGLVANGLWDSHRASRPRVLGYGAARRSGRPASAAAAPIHPRRAGPRRHRGVALIV